MIYPQKSVPQTSDDHSILFLPLVRLQLAFNVFLGRIVKYYATDPRTCCHFARIIDDDRLEIVMKMRRDAASQIRATHLDAVVLRRTRVNDRPSARAHTPISHLVSSPSDRLT